MLPWNYITENALNLANVMNDIVDPNNPKDVTWYVRQEDGSLKEVKIPNLAKAFGDAVDSLKNDLNKVVNEYLMFSDTEPAKDVNPPYVGFIYVKYNKTEPDRSEIYVCVDNTKDNNVWGKVSGGEIVILVSDDSDLKPNTKYFADTDSKAITLTLPSNPKDNDLIVISDGSYNAQNNVVTVNRNNKTINGKEEDLVCDVNGFYVILRYDANKDGWFVSNAVTNN